MPIPAAIVEGLMQKTLKAQEEMASPFDKEISGQLRNLQNFQGVRPIPFDKFLKAYEEGVDPDILAQMAAGLPPQDLSNFIQHVTQSPDMYSKDILSSLEKTVPVEAYRNIDPENYQSHEISHNDLGQYRGIKFHPSHVDRIASKQSLLQKALAAQKAAIPNRERALIQQKVQEQMGAPASAAAAALPPLEAIPGLEAKEDHEPVRQPIQQPFAPSRHEQGHHRLAPFNPLHKESEDILKQSIAQGRQNSGRTSDELNKSDRYNIPEMLAPIYQQASIPMSQYVQQNYQDISEPYLKSLEDRIKKSFFEDEKPAIDAQFAARGNFYSGAHKQAVRKAKEAREAMLGQEIAKAKMHEIESLRQHHHGHQGRALEHAGVAGQMAQAQQGHHLKKAEALQNEDLQRRGAHRQDAEAISQLAHQHQKQKQSELDLRQQEAEYAREKPIRDIAQQAAIASLGTEQPFQLPSTSMGPQPTPPHALSAGLGAMMQSAPFWGNRQNHANGFAEGGHVKKYAKGGPIQRALAEMKELNKHANMEQNPYEQQMMQQSNQLMNDTVDPAGRYLHALGTSMLGNLRDPMKGYAEGSRHGMEAYDAARSHNREGHDKALNLMNKINESRQYQQKIFQDFYHGRDQEENLKDYRKSHLDIDRQKLEEDKRYHNLQAAESRRAHDMSYESKRANDRYESNPYVPQFSSKAQETAYYRTESKLADKLHDKREALAQSKEAIQGMKDAYEGGIGYTGEVGGFLPTAMMADASERPNRRLFEQESIGQVLDRLNTLKGTQSDKDMEVIIKTAPNVYDRPPVIEAWLKKASAKIDKEEQKMNALDSLVEQGVPIQVAEREVSKLMGKSGSSSGKVKVKGPDGSVWEIPSDQVEAAEQRGAKRI